MAREGLRTLVVAKRTLTEEQYQDFEVSYICPCRLSLFLLYENRFLDEGQPSCTGTRPVFLKFGGMDYLSDWGPCDHPSS